MAHQNVGAVSQLVAQKIALILLWVEVVDGLILKTFALGTLPLSIVENYHEKERLHMDVVELQNLTTEG
jgi:hypothetical protein